jgi:predicted nuclease of predicted toxin-antitoxin system
MAIFLIDAQLPPALAVRLRDAGHEAVHVHELRMDSASDVTVARTAASRNAILVSKDEDFAAMSKMGELECPFLWIRLGNTTNAALWRQIEPLLEAVLDAFRLGEMVVEVV